VELNGIHQIFIHADDTKVPVENINTTTKVTDTSLVAIEDVGLEVNSKNLRMYKLMCVTLPIIRKRKE
jgi:hypothetical protein